MVVQQDHFPLSCFYKPVDDLFKLFNATGLERPELESKGCDFMDIIKCLVSVPLSALLTENNSS